MLKLSEHSIEELRHLRKNFLYMYVFSETGTPKHAKFGEEADRIGLELNRRTGDTKYKM